MSEVIEVDIKQPKVRVTVSVNGNDVDLTGPRVTGLQVKQAAINQGVKIDLDFVLSMLIGASKAKIIGDDDIVTVNKNSEFIATAHDDNSEGPVSVTLEINQAINEIKAAFFNSKVKVRADGDGGAYVTSWPVTLGDQYQNSESWIGFHITFQYPYADIYPHFVNGDLKRKDGKELGAGMSSSTFDGKPAIQISRRSNHLDPNRDTAVLKLLKVIDWIRSQ